MNPASTLRVFVTDDEAPARRKLLRFLAEEPDVVIVGETSNGPDTISGVRDTRPDLIFLDIQMPGMDGFEIVDALGEVSPKIIFVTAHDEYALRALEIHAFDYLLKPFDQTRFSKVLADARHEAVKVRQRESHVGPQHLQKEVRSPRNPRLLVEENGRGILVALNLIDWAEADRNYVKLHLGSHTYTVRGTIEGIEQKLDSGYFLRINRSALIRMDFIDELQKWTHGEYRVILRSGQTLMWTRRYLDRHSDLLRKI
ncbi:LytR/AlgR family response regulator transcription factor [Silvibacterium acidisoli]|uniref:LytR/AlgR family response regulator transcription factor n=1 Tax=Acidobacteriaceae bacterium ZG23-2 TaxID=2883246 RepID=UPI00406C9E91